MLAQHLHQNNEVHMEFADWNANTDTNGVYSEYPILTIVVTFRIYACFELCNGFQVKNNISVFNGSDTKQWETV